MTKYKPTGSISACSPDKWKEHSHTTGSISACAPNKADYAIELLKDAVTTLPPPADSIFNIENLTLDDPKHYTSHPSGIETIEITRWMNFNLGNSIKYILRSGKKSEESAIQDLEKAVWYINDEIKRLKGEYNK